MRVTEFRLSETGIKILFLLAAFSFLSCLSGKETAVSASAPASFPSRIISTVPSLTEILFTLGLGEKTAGVSDYCRYPAEAQKLPKIGGLYNPNLERMIELKPDLVLLLTEHSELKTRLEQVRISTLSVDHSSVSGILDSFEAIGARCGVAEKGVQVRRELEARMNLLRERVSEEESVRTLIVIDRDLAEGKITQVYAAGKNPYFNEILELAGGVNILADSASAVPTISREVILEKNPDVIIDLSSFRAANENPETIKKMTEREKRDWKSLDAVSAVKKNRVYPIHCDYAVIPGPRFLLFAELLVDLLHPK